MRSLIPCLLAASLFSAGCVTSAFAATFQFTGIGPVAAVRGTSPPPMTANFTVNSPGTTTAWTATLEGSPSWALLSSSSGSGAGSLNINFSTTGLAAGTYSSALVLNSGGSQSRLAFTLTVITPSVIKMEADYNRPVIYALHAAASSTTAPGYVIVLNTNTEQVEQVIPAGVNPTDMDLSYAEDKLYVTNHQQSAGSIRVIDPASRKEVRALAAGSDIYKINAGKSGRIVTEGWDQWIAANLRNSTTGASIASLSPREGDGEFDPAGRYYYHCDNNISNAHIERYDLQGDTFVAGPSSVERAYGSRNLVMSGDGTRLFWQGYAYDANLNELRSFGNPIYATTFRGEVAFSQSSALNAATGATLATLPVTTTVMAVSGNQQKLFLFNNATGGFTRVLMSSIATVPPPVSIPIPADEGVVMPPLSRLEWTTAAGVLRYRVFFGSDEAAVAAATTASPLYLGETAEVQRALPSALTPGTTYYWRVDPVGFNGSGTGPVWEFTVSGLVASPNRINLKIPRGTPARTVAIATSAASGGAWTATESLPWLTLSAAGGNAGDSLNAIISVAGLSAGSYSGNILFSFDGRTVPVPVTLDAFDLALTKMTADPTRPWIYGLHGGTPTAPESYVVFVNTVSRQVENVLAAGIGATDFAINHQEAKLYVSNWQSNVIQVIDLTTQTLLSPIPSGRDIYKLNAGRAGRIYAEGEDQWVSGWIIDSVNGSTIGNNSAFFREGDGEVDPTNRYYYHCDNNSSGAAITKYDISADTWTSLKSSINIGYGSRNLVLSPDGSRLFWMGRAFDAELNALRDMGAEVYATTHRGELAVTSEKVLNTATGAQLATLPVTTTVSAVAGDQSGLFYFNPNTRLINFLAMSSIAPVPVPGTNVQPPNGSMQLAPVTRLSWDTVPSALKYRIYIGSAASAVAAATTASPEYAGETVENYWVVPVEKFPPGGSFYWRVEYVGFSSSTSSSVRFFQTLPVTVSPNSVAVRTIRGAPPVIVSLPVTGTAGTAWTASTSGAAWLRVLTAGGTAGTDALQLELTSGSLAAGTYSGSVTLTSGGQSATVPVQFTIESASYVALKADPVRPRIYALQRPDSLTGAVAVINTASGTVERTVPVSDNPTDFDLSADGQFLYVVTRGGRKMHRIDLETWASAEQPLPATADHSDAAVRYRVAGGSGDMVYWVDGQWAPVLHSMDFATGQEKGTPITADGSNGFGAIARTGGGSGLAAWSQYGWSAGSSGSKAILLTAGNAGAAVVSSGASLQRDPLDTPVIVRADSSAVFMKQYKLSATLSDVVTEYPGEVYAATKTSGIVFGTTQAWRERTATPVWQAPAGVDVRICAVASDQSAFFYFNKASQTLVRLPMSTFGDIPGPSPENGEVVSVMPAQLSWTPHPQAQSYNVYFGTNQAGVQSAAGSGSPYFLGSSTEASLPLTVPFKTAGVWWWRVDTVLAGSTVTGSIWKFTGAVTYVSRYPGIRDSIGSGLSPAVALEGGMILSGYPLFNTSYPNYAGKVLVHRKRPGIEEWEEVQKIDKPAGSAAAAQFGSSLAVKGDIAWIGAPGDGTGGCAYEYQFDSNSQEWAPTGRSVQPSTPVAGDLFGLQIAFDGVLLAVAAPGTSVSSVYQAGAVDIFDATTLTRHARLTEATPTSYVQFGRNMALGDGFIAIGSPSRRVSSVSEAGAVDVWTRGTGTSWSRTATVTAPSPAAMRYFGSSVAVSGNRLFAGTPSNTSAGKVFVYQKGTGTAWSYAAQIDRGGAARTDTYGSSLAVSGNRLFVGTPSSVNTASVTGQSVWLHQNLSGSAWTSVAPAASAGSSAPVYYGQRLAMNDRYLVSSYNTDANSTPGFVVHLHNPEGNLPPYVTSRAKLFAEVGKPYRYVIAAADENPDDEPLITSRIPLPAWLQLEDHDDGTAVLFGTPPEGAEGDLPLSLKVADRFGGETPYSYILKVLPPGGIPEFSSITGDQTSDDGKRMVLSAAVVPGAPVTWQWYLNGNLLSGETGATLTIERVQASDAGDYVARATRNGIWTDSGVMRLTVNQVADRFGGDWPTFGASPSHTGAYPATLGKHKFLPAWTVASGGIQQVATGNGRLYSVAGFSFGNSGLSAYDLATGTRLWNAVLPSSFSLNPPTYHRGRLYMQRGKGTGDSPELRCYDAASGIMQWKADFSAQWESYFAPAVDDSGVYINGGYYGGIYRFGLDGVQRFYLGMEQYDDWTPLLHDGKIYSWVAGNFRQHDAQGGEAKFTVSVPWNWSGWSMNTVAAAEDDVAVMHSTTELIAIDLTARRVLWRKAKVFRGSPAIRDGRVYSITEGAVETYDAHSGAPGRTYPTRTAAGQSASGVHQPVILDDVLIVSSPDLIWVFDLTTGTLLQQLTGGGPLTYTDGYLIAAGTDNALRAWQVNQPAVITPPGPSLAATEDIPFQWDLTVSDPDGDVPGVSFSDLPPWLNAGPLQQGVIRLSGTPLDPHAGDFSFTVTVDDGKSFPSVLSLQGSVMAVNDRPLAVSPAAVNAEEDAVLAAIPLTAVFSDEEDAFTGLALALTENSNPALFSQAVIDGGQLRLALVPDAFGEAVLKLKATDSGGLSVETELAVRIAAVPDAPRLVLNPAPPVIPADGSAFAYSLAPLFSDPDPGESLRWILVSVDRPELFRSLTVDAGTGQLLADWTPYVWGSATAIVRATGSDGLSAETQVVLSIAEPPAPDWSLAGALTLNRQTGLFEQRITVKNNGPRAIAGFDLMVSGHGDTMLYNGMMAPPAGSAASGGQGVLPYAIPLESGAEVTLVMEFYSPTRRALFAMAGSAPLNPLTPQALMAPAAAGAFSVSRVLPVAEGMLVEFPTEPGCRYRVEYSADNQSWKPCPLPLQGGGTCIQWIDRGPPFTTAAPHSVSQRFYRVRKLDP